MSEGEARSDEPVANREDLLEDGARRLKIALLPAIAVAVVLKISLSDKAFVVVLGLTALTWWIGGGGIARVAAALQMSGDAYRSGRFALFFPLLNVVSLLYFLGRSRGWGSQRVTLAPHRETRVSDAEQARERARQRAAARAAAPAPTAAALVAVADPAAAGGARPAAAAAPASPVHPMEVAAKVLPAIKFAGLPPGTDGATLQIRVAAGAEALGLPAGASLPADSQPVIRVTPDGFGVVYLVDEDSHYRYLTRSELKKAGTTPNELHQRSLLNLALLVNGDQPGLRVAPNDAFHALLMGGQFEASLMLLDGLWDETLAPQTPNGAVVAVAARDICAFCDAGNAAGIAQLQALARRVHAGGDHAISDRLFVRRKGRWQAHPDSRAADLGPLEFTT